jgi:DNA mismatch endonuclease, patch repair protein
MLWRRGFRFRKHVAHLPGCPDVIFARNRLAIFVDGDFWHGRDWTNLRAQLQRRANPGYWIAKIGRNRERDLTQTMLLEAEGWTVLRIWESDVLKNPDLHLCAIETRLLRLADAGTSP